MAKPANEADRSQAPKQDLLSDADLDAVNGGSRQTSSQSFGTMVRQGTGQVVSGASVVGGSQDSQK